MLDFKTTSKSLAFFTHCATAVHMEYGSKQPKAPPQTPATLQEVHLSPLAEFDFKATQFHIPAIEFLKAQKIQNPEAQVKEESSSGFLKGLFGCFSPKKHRDGDEDYSSRTKGRLHQSPPRPTTFQLSYSISPNSEFLNLTFLPENCNNWDMQTRWIVRSNGMPLHAGMMWQVLWRRQFF